MITPDEIREKALRYWENQSFLRSVIKGDSLFPLSVAFSMMKSGEMLEHFEALRSWLRELRAHSKEQTGYGYSVDFAPLQHRQLGEQLLPQRIFFETEDDFLRFIGKQREYVHHLQLIEATLSAHPELRPWLERKPAAVLKYRDAWPRLMEVCAFFKSHPRPNRYIRELDIPGVDSKFIEAREGILRELLDCVLPEEAVASEHTGLREHGFEKRYGLKYDEPPMRFRILDKALEFAPGVSDLTIPFSSFTNLNIACRRVFITENKINGLSFPPVKSSIVIFGLGYGIQSLQTIDWLKTKEILYWGDIDPDGFNILSQLRAHHPQTRSFLMDRRTLLKHTPLCVQDPKAARYPACVPPNLTTEETVLYLELRDNAFGERVRLEQERIEFRYVREMLTRLCRDDMEKPINAC